MHDSLGRHLSGTHRGELQVKERKGRLLKVAFIAGAITDVGALLPMLSPRLAGLLWGLRDMPASYRLAMGSGASLMLGWTILLVWAYQRPIERRAIAAFTMVVIVGLILAEIWAVRTGVLAAGRMAPTFALQSVLLGLFGAAFYSGRAERSVAA
jgi:hypothetical protein